MQMEICPYWCSLRLREREGQGRGGSRGCGGTGKLLSVDNVEVSKSIPRYTQEPQLALPDTTVLLEGRNEGIGDKPAISIFVPKGKSSGLSTSLQISRRLVVGDSIAFGEFWDAAGNWGISIDDGMEGVHLACSGVRYVVCRAGMQRTAGRANEECRYQFLRITRQKLNWLLLVRDTSGCHVV